MLRHCFRSLCLGGQVNIAVRQIDGRAFKHAVSPQSIPLFARQYLIGEQFGHAQASPASLASTISSASSIGLVSSPSSSIRSDEHTSELQSLMRLSYAVFRLKKNNHQHNTTQ